MLDVVTFDAGQTLVELDLDFLAAKLSTQGVAASGEGLARVQSAAWQHYDAHVRAGRGKTWHAFMEALLAGAGIERAHELTEWLWSEQPARNLWRRPIADMVALARELAAAGTRVAVLSNSEGRLGELLAEIGIADAFACVIDSGREGIEKPDPRMFARVLERVGGAADRAAHVGDSWSADVAGALGAGWRAVWYRPGGALADAPLPPSPRWALARDARGVRAALAAFADAGGGERARDRR